MNSGGINKSDVRFTGGGETRPIEGVQKTLDVDEHLLRFNPKHFKSSQRHGLKSQR